MGSDDLFKKKRQAREKRRHDFVKPKANSYLIVTEGERTEPLYFKGIAKHITDYLGGKVDVHEIPAINIDGEGCATGVLIRKTEELVSKSKIIYENIWIVFDKDDFTDFDEAIRDGELRNYKVAWSNQSFEYWLYLHFCYSDSALHRDDWSGKLSELFKEKNIGNGVYKKNYEDIYDLVNCNDGVNTAIKNAKRRMSSYQKDRMKPSDYDPGTTVHMLVEELRRYLNE